MNKRIKITLVIALIIIIVGILYGVFYFKKPDTNTSQENIKISGDFGPYTYDKSRGAIVAVSNKIRAVAFYENDKGYVFVNDKKFGPYDGIDINSLKVSDNFWGIVSYSSKKTVVINGNEVELSNDADSVKLSFSDEKNSWGILYFDQVNGYKVIINNNFSTEAKYYELNGIATAYQKDDGNYYVRVYDKEYLLGDYEGAGFAQCVVYNQNKWGCSVKEQDGAWHIFIYENGIKKEYGSYGKFSDPRDGSGFKLSNDGFIFCASDLAVIFKNESEKLLHAQDIHQCNYAEGNFSFIHLSDKNNNELLVNVNDKEYGPYALIDNFSFTSVGWGFSGYNKETEKSDYVVNGTIISDANVVAGPSISNDYWAFGYDKNGQLYMKVEEFKKVAWLLHPECSETNPPKIEFTKSKSGNEINLCGDRFGSAYEFKKENIIIFQKNNLISVISTMPPYKESILSNSAGVFIPYLGFTAEAANFDEKNLTSFFKNGDLFFWHADPDGMIGTKGISTMFIFSPKSLEFVYASNNIIGTKSKQKIANKDECNTDLWKINLAVQSMSERFPNGFPCLSRSYDEQKQDYKIEEIGYFDLVQGQFVSK